MSRQRILSLLAEAFGRRVARELPRGARPAHRRLRQIARILDRLARRPTMPGWHRRAARVGRALDLPLPVDSVAA